MKNRPENQRHPEEGDETRRLRAGLREAQIRLRETGLLIERLLEKQAGRQHEKRVIRRPEELVRIISAILVPKARPGEMRFEDAVHVGEQWLEDEAFYPTFTFDIQGGYEDFLQQFFPALREELRKNGAPWEKISRRNDGMHRRFKRVFVKLFTEVKI